MVVIQEGKNEYLDKEKSGTPALHFLFEFWIFNCEMESLIRQKSGLMGRNGAIFSF